MTDLSNFMVLTLQQAQLEKAMEFLLYNFFDPKLSCLSPDVAFDSGEADLWSNHYEEGDIVNIWPGQLVLRFPLKLDYLLCRAEREDGRCKKSLELSLSFTGEDHYFNVGLGNVRCGFKTLYHNSYVYGENNSRLRTFEDGSWREQILQEAARRGCFRQVA